MRIEDEDGADATAKRADIIKQMQAYAEQQQKISSEETQDTPVEGAGGAAPSSADGDGASGVQLHARAVEAANNQQDTGEAWLKYKDNEEAAVPVSVEQLAQQERQEEVDERKQQERISVQALMTEFKIKNGIPS